MIQLQTILKVSDNSGAKDVKCIKVITGKGKAAKLGDLLIVTVKSLKNRNKIMSKVKKGELYKGLLIRTKKKIFTKDGSNFKFEENSVILLNKNNKLIATRIIGPLPKYLKKNKIVKTLNISTGIV